MKTLKKSKPVLFTLVICLAFLMLFSQAAFAADGVKLSASSETGITDKEVTVKINIANAKDTEGGQFELSFDSDIIEPKSITRGNFVPDTISNQFGANLELDDGKIIVLWVIGEGSELDSGVVATIVFDAVGDGETNLTFSGIIMSPDDVDFDTPTSGEVIVMDAAAAKAAAIKAADDAIAALPTPVTLADKTDVAEARDLVDEAKDDHGAVDADFSNLAVLVAAEEMIKKLEAVKAADDAILALPSIDSLKLDDKADVVAARALVNKAKVDHGAVDADFTYLARLTAAENRIKELEGLQPTPPTGGMQTLFLSGLMIIIVGLLAYIKRRSLAVS